MFLRFLCFGGEKCENKSGDIWRAGGSCPPATDGLFFVAVELLQLSFYPWKWFNLFAICTLGFYHCVERSEDEWFNYEQLPADHT